MKDENIVPSQCPLQDKPMIVALIYFEDDIDEDIGMDNIEIPQAEEK